jgi:biopolymer transport protein TolR
VSQPKQPVVVSIDAQGQPFRDKDPLTLDMMPRLKELTAQDPAQVVLVRGDRAVPYGRIVEIMGQVSAAGFSKKSLRDNSWTSLKSLP